MTTPEINNAENFFQAISKGLVTNLQELVNRSEPEEIVEMINLFNSEGETPLIVAIKEDRYDIVKFLVEDVRADTTETGRFKWKGIVYEEALPLFVAILSSRTGTQSIVNFLMSQDTDTYRAFSDLKSYFSSITMPCSQQFDILDLIGSAYMLYPNFDPVDRIRIATICWSWILEFRDLRFVQTSDPSFLKTPNSLSESAQKIFGQTTEFRTEDELNEIYYSQEYHIRFQTQALLVIERITSRLDPDPNPFYLRCLLQYGTDWFTTAPQYNCMVDVVNFILELFQSRQWKDVINFECLCCNEPVYDAVESIKYSCWMKKEPPPDRSQLPFDSFMDVINSVSELLFKLQKYREFVRKQMALKFVGFIEDSIRMFTENDQEGSPEFKKWFAGYIKFINSHPGVTTALHVHCQSVHLSTKIVQLFLDGGADPNAQDDDGNSPLHHLAKSKDFTNVAAATKLLLSKGAHLDQSHKHGVTPLDYFKERKRYLDHNGLSDPYIDALTRTVLPLSCLSAQVIRQNSIPFQDQKELPSHLIPFVKRHSAKCVSNYDLYMWYYDRVFEEVKLEEIGILHEVFEEEAVLNNNYLVLHP